MVVGYAAGVAGNEEDVVGWVGGRGLGLGGGRRRRRRRGGYMDR